MPNLTGVALADPVCESARDFSARVDEDRFPAKAALFQHKAEEEERDILLKTKVASKAPPSEKKRNKNAKYVQPPFSPLTDPPFDPPTSQQGCVLRTPSPNPPPCPMPSAKREE